MIDIMDVGIDLSGHSTQLSVPLKPTNSLYTFRVMTRLRKAAFLLYQSQPFSLVASRLEVCLCLHAMQ